jgi:hypothetical protein
MAINKKTPLTFSPSKLTDPTNPSSLDTPPQSEFGNPSASSGGGASPLGRGPYIPPDQLQAWADRLMGLDAVYSIEGGGYRSAADANNANSYYSKFGGSDPRANQRVEDFYGDLGALPTAPNTTGALSQFNQQRGITPRLGPSINETLGHPWQGPWNIDKTIVPQHVGYG